MLLTPSFQGQQHSLTKRSGLRIGGEGQLTPLAVMGEVFCVAAPAGHCVYLQPVVL